MRLKVVRDFEKEKFATPLLYVTIRPRYWQAIPVKFSIAFAFIKVSVSFDNEKINNLPSNM